MDYRKLGKSNLTVSAVSLGCMSLPADLPAAQSIIDLAFDTGINYFDTADLYGQGENERIIGKALAAKRKDVLIATKVGNKFVPGVEGWNWVPSKKYILSAVEDSLKRLNTDYIDLYQLHGGTLEDPFDEIVEAFELLVKQGKIRYYGISSIRPAVIEKYVSSAAIVSVMLQYSLLDRRPEAEVLPLLEKTNTGVMVRGSLAKGLLINKPPVHYLSHQPAAIQHLTGVMQQLVTPERNMTAIALQYVLGNNAVTSAVTGISRTAQLNDIVQALKSPMITVQERQMLSEAIAQHRYDI